MLLLGCPHFDGCGKFGTRLPQVEKGTVMLSRRILTTLPVAAIVLGFGPADRVSTSHTQAQQSASPTLPAFEVGSVKRSSPGPGPIRIETLPGGRFITTNVSLRALIQYAYRPPSPN
jgi:hypothetical protein